MSKPFITYTAQVEKLKNEKNLVITDDDFAVESLQNVPNKKRRGASAPSPDRRLLKFLQSDH